MTQLPKHPYRPRREREPAKPVAPPRSVSADIVRALLFVLVAAGVVRLVLTIDRADPLTAVVRM